jgi:acylphosphatase
MTVRRKQYLLSGRVQGVGFRYFACRLARELGLSGWVRNLANGDVEIEAQGEEERLEQFLLKVKSGLQPAVVRDISIAERETLELRGDFTIER